MTYFCRAAFLLAVSSIALAACGGSQETTGQPQAAPETAQPPAPAVDYVALATTALADPDNANPIVLTDPESGQVGDVIANGIQQYFATATDDPWIHPYVDLSRGAKNGFDIYGTVDTSQERPGEGEIDGHVGSLQLSTFWLEGDKPGDLFLVGDAVGPYYAGKRSASDRETDFVYIYRIELPGAIVRLHGTALDYRTAVVVNPGTGDRGTALFYVAAGTDDLVAFLDDVVLSDSDLRGAIFEYDTAPSSAPVVNGLAQFGNGGYQLFGRITADPSGAIYQSFLTSGPQIADGVGTGTFYVAKFNPDGSRAWLRRHGPGFDPANAQHGFAPFSLAADGANVFVAGSGKDSLGGPAPILNGVALTRATVARIDAGTGELVEAMQYSGPEFLANAWSVAVDGQGGVFVGGGTGDNGVTGPGLETVVINGETLSFPDTSPFILRTSGGDLDSIDWKDVILDGSDPVFGFTPDRWQLSNEAIGNIAYAAGARRGEGRLFFSGYAAFGDFLGATVRGVNDAWAAGYSEDGRRLWARTIGAADGDQYPYGTATDGDAVYVVGQTMGSFPGEPAAGQGDAFIVKLDADTGDIAWRRLAGGGDADDFADVTIDEAGFIWAVGSTQSDFAGSNAGMRDAIIVKYDANGVELARRQFGTTKLDYGRGIVVRNGTVYVSGMTEGSMVGPYSGRGFDVFIATFEAAAL